MHGKAIILAIVTLSLAGPVMAQISGPTIVMPPPPPPPIEHFGHPEPPQIPNPTCTQTCIPDTTCGQSVCQPYCTWDCH